MSKQGYTPNFKWSVAGVDLVASYARKGWTAENICLELRGIIEATPSEIVRLMADMSIHVPSRVVRAAQ